MKNMKTKIDDLAMVIQVTPEDYDSDDVRFEANGEKIEGFGYKSKKDGTIHIMRCPICKRENYLAQPICVWCGFDPLEIEK